MSFERLPETVLTLHSELLEQSIHAEAEAARHAAPEGSFVRKEVKGRSYWYQQVSEGERKRQHYLGADSPELQAWMDEVRRNRQENGQDTAQRARLCTMLRTGGAFRETAAVIRVLEILASSGVFRLGGVLVGSFEAPGRFVGRAIGCRGSGNSQRPDLRRTSRSFFHITAARRQARLSPGS
jgi:hypothetical protein